jgi:hypothetical protein
MFTPLLYIYIFFFRELINEALAVPMAQAVSRRLPTALTWIRSEVSAGFVVDEVALGHVFSEYLGFFRQLLYH